MNLGLHPRNEPPGRRAYQRLDVRILVVVQLLILYLAWITGSMQAATLPEASGLRFGENGTRTRIVLDFDRKVGFATRIATGPDRLIVQLGEVQWRLGADAGRPLRGVARGYEIATSNGNSTLWVALDRPVRVANNILLPPSKDSSFHRLVIDVVAEPATAGRPALGVAGVATAAAAVAPAPAGLPLLFRHLGRPHWRRCRPSRPQAIAFHPEPPAGHANGRWWCSTQGMAVWIPAPHRWTASTRRISSSRWPASCAH